MDRSGLTYSTAFLVISFLMLSVFASGQSRTLSQLSLSELLDAAYPLEGTNPDSALFIYDYVFQRAVAADSILPAAKALQYSGFVHMSEGDFEQSTQKLKQAMPFFEEISYDRGLMGCWNGLANIANFRAQHSLAAEGYEKALQYCHDLNTRITITNNVASVLQHTGNADRSLVLLRDIESRFDESVEPLSRAYTYNNLGVGYNAVNQVEEARTYFQKSLTASDLAGSGSDACLACLNVVATFSREREQPYNQALVTECLNKARLILDTIQIPRHEPFYLRLKAEDLYINRKYDQALKTCLQSADELQNFEDVEERIKVYLLLIDIYKALNQHEDALHYSEDLKLLNDSLLYNSNNNKILELEAQYQTAQKDAELAKKEIIITRQQITRNYLLGGLLLLVLLAAFLLSRARLRQKIKDNLIQLKQEKIHNLEKQQKLLALDYMVQGQEEERKRIAKDLHDGLGGILTTARLQLRNIEGEVQKMENLQLFERAEGLLKDASAEVRRIAHDMMPDALVNFGLLDAIQDLADNNSTDQLSVITNFYSRENKFTEKQEINIYRIIQEIINNAIKHADASEINIEFSETESQYQLIVSDNGIGFNLEETDVEKGHGLRNIESRANYLNSNLKINTSVGKGTEYDFQIPKN